jgi:hypothetical protein
MLRIAIRQFRYSTLATSNDIRMPELALHPLLEALRHASHTELCSITKGLNILSRLLSRTAKWNGNVLDELEE